MLDEREKSLYRRLMTKSGKKVLAYALWKHWREWMNSSTIGRRIQQAWREEKRTKIPLVIEANSDGYIRVFGSKEISVVFVTPLTTLSDKASEIAEELAELSLPKNHREYYRDQSKLIGTWKIESVSPAKKYTSNLIGEMYAKLPSNA